MPPRSSKRTRRAAAAQAAPDPAAGTLDSSTPGLDRTSILPADILLEIISYFHCVPITHRPNDNYEYHLPPDEPLERQDALRSLSQTCRNWRAFFLPLLWENVETAGIRTGGGAWHKQCLDALVSRCEGLAANPELAQYVRGFRFVLSSHSADIALANVVKGIKACPNLKTLCVYFAQSNSGKAIKEAGIQKHTFPTIERLFTPYSARPFLQCCPNVREVDGPGTKDILKALKAKFKSIEVVANIDGDAATIKKLIQAAPGLREIRFATAPYPVACESLGEFKHLRSITIRTEFFDVNGTVEEYFATELAEMKKVLRNCAVTLKGYGANYRVLYSTQTVRM